MPIRRVQCQLYSKQRAVKVSRCVENDREQDIMKLAKRKAGLVQTMDIFDRRYARPSHFAAQLTLGMVFMTKNFL